MLEAAQEMLNEQPGAQNVGKDDLIGDYSRSQQKQEENTVKTP
jgi:hypothetical protein